MATIDEKHAATNAKLDELMEKMGALTGWMQTMSATTTELTKSTALLQLHAEDTASRLGLLETGAITRPANITEPIAPTTTVVRTDTDKQPNGRGEALHLRGQDSGSLGRPICLRPTVRFMMHDSRSTEVLSRRICVSISHSIHSSHTKTSILSTTSISTTIPSTARRLARLLRWIFQNLMGMITRFG
jgi:hypothetical protein